MTPANIPTLRFVPAALVLASALVFVLAFAGCRMDRSGDADASAEPPDWARSALWYQVFVERFDNGDPTNDPTLDDIAGSWPHIRPAGWAIKPWTSDWYGRSAWETAADDDFYHTVQLRRYGGDLQGVINRLGHIQALGANAIYLNPINDSPSLHKYDARAYRHVDRNFGPDPIGDALIMEEEDPTDPSTWRWTAADSLFLRLIDAVHARGMRVIVDYSWNHTGLTHSVFRDVAEQQAESRFADWYRINSFDDPATPENEFSYEGWAGVAELPEFAQTVPDGDSGRRSLQEDLQGDLHAGPKKLVFDVTRRWLDPNGDGDPSDGVDGFRLDVAEMVPLGFWRDYRTFVKSINPDAFLVGEIWWEQWPVRMLDPRPYLGEAFDAVMNYRWYMPTRSWIAGALPAVTAPEYEAHLDSIEAGIPRRTLEAMMNVAATHDSPRLSTSLQNKGVYKSGVNFRDNPQYDVGPPDSLTRARQRLLLMAQYTYYGAPHIWAGDELGMWGGDDPDNRKPIWWPELEMGRESTPGPGGGSAGNRVSADLDLLEYYRRLGAMRSEYSDVFVNGELAYLFADSSGALGYSRTYGGRRISVLLNAGDTAKELTFTELGLSMPTVALSSGGYQSDGSGITVGGWSGVVLTESDEVP